MHGPGPISEEIAGCIQLFGTDSLARAHVQHVTAPLPRATRPISTWIAFALVGCASSSSSNDTDGAGSSSSATSEASGPVTVASTRAADSSSTHDDAASTVTPGTSDDGASESTGAPHEVTACDSLAAVGSWEEITPPVAPLPDAEPCPYGGAFVMNPQDPAMLYVGSCNQGIWKTEDCGASWTHINTGNNGATLDAGRQWTFAIDPGDPEVLYTNSGYGAFHNGAFKSTNGGVDWEVLWPPADPAFEGIVAYDFVASVVLDPFDSQHLLVSFHATCAPPHSEACFAESPDGGASWRWVDGQPQWVGGEGQFVYFLDASDTWLWGSQSNGLWRTVDAGASWVAVTDDMAQGHGAGQLYRAADGTFYLPVLAGILRSTDGVAWDIVPDSGSVMAGLTGNGTTMWASRGFPWDPSDDLYLPFWSASEADGTTWTQMDTPVLSNGGALAYDPDHQLLYSSNLGAGVWRVVVE
jgi:hypothetical protein